MFRSWPVNGVARHCVLATKAAATAGANPHSISAAFRAGLVRTRQYHSRISSAAITTSTVSCKPTLWFVTQGGALGHLSEPRLLSSEPKHIYAKAVLRTPPSIVPHTLNLHHIDWVDKHITCFVSLLFVFCSLRRISCMIIYLYVDGRIPW